jgi:hypothetical protein
MMSKQLVIVLSCAIVFSGLAFVKADTTDGYLVPELRYRDGSPVYAHPVSVEVKNTTGAPDAGTAPDAQPSGAQPLLADSWWNQYHHNYYKDGYANTNLEITASNSAKISLGYGQKISGSPVVTAQKAMVQNYDNMYAYNFDFSSGATPVWTITNQKTHFSAASDGTYVWNIILYVDGDGLQWGCMDKFYVSTGAVATYGPCWLLSSVDHFTDIVYTSVGPGGQGQHVYVLVDYLGSSPPAGLYSYDAQTLVFNWRTYLETHITQSSPVVLQRTYEVREIMLGDNNGKFYVFREDNGVISAYYNTGTAIKYAATIDISLWAQVYVVTTGGKLYKFDKNSFNSISKVWERQLEGVVNTFTSPVNAGNWVFVKMTYLNAANYNYYNRVTMVMKNNSISYSSASVGTAIEWNSGNAIVPSIAVTNNHVFSPYVFKSATNYYYPSVMSLIYNSAGQFTSQTYFTCQNSPYSASPVFAVDSSPAIVYQQSTNKWLLYFTWYYNNGAGDAGACKFPLV